MRPRRRPRTVKQPRDDPRPAAIEAVTKAFPERDIILKNAHRKIAEGRALSGDLAAAIRIEPASARRWGLGGAADGYRQWKRPDLLR